MDIRGHLIDLGGGDIDDVDELSFFFKEFKGVTKKCHSVRYLCVFYPMVIMCRLFKAFAAQPRLALVTRTLSMAAIDVGHFGIVFVTIFFSYAVMGHTLFGREVYDFSDLGRSVNSCFCILMGDFDLSEMRA